MSKLAFDDWLAKMEKLLAGTQNQREKAVWQMGYKTGRRQTIDKMLDNLSKAGILYWSEPDRVWFSIADGRKVPGLDWREEDA